MGSVTKKRRTPKKKRRRTRRTVPAVSIRKWVTEKEGPENIARELVARIKAVDKLVTPYYEAFEHIHQLVEKLAQEQGRKRGAPWTRQHTIWHARTIAFLGIVAAWSEHPYKPGWYLPRLVFQAHSGPLPWDPLPPDAIHVLDLPIEGLKAGFQKSGVEKALNQVRQPDRHSVSPGGEDPPAWVFAPLAIVIIRSQGPEAFRNLWVMSVLEQLRWEADYADTKKARQEAAFWVDRLQAELSPKLHKHVSRSPGKLQKDIEVYRGVYAKLLSLRNAVGMESELLRKAQRIDPALHRQDLSRFNSEDFLHQVALRATTRHLKLTWDTVAKRRSWLHQMVSIEETWEEFRGWYDDAKHELKRLLKAPPLKAFGFSPSQGVIRRRQARVKAAAQGSAS